jgi:hypothetical protein
MSHRLVGHSTCENHGEDNIVAEQEEQMTFRVVNLSYEVVKFAMTNPEKAKTLSKVFVFIGIIGVGILAITHFTD